VSELRVSGAGWSLEDRVWASASRGFPLPLLRNPMGYLQRVHIFEAYMPEVRQYEGRASMRHSSAGPFSWGPPNPRLQRTRAARSPLSRQPFSLRFAQGECGVKPELLVPLAPLRGTRSSRPIRPYGATA